MPKVEITTPDSPTENKRLLSAWGLVYVAVCYGVSFLLPAYDIEVRPEASHLFAAGDKSSKQQLHIPGWLAFRLSAIALLNPKLEEGQRLAVALMLLANIASWLGFFLGMGGRWRASALAALTALCFGATSLVNPRLVLDEFRAGYYVWLGSFALLALVAGYSSLGRTLSAPPSAKPQ
jgi:hypothetical protein